MSDLEPKGVVERDCYVDGCDRTVAVEIWNDLEHAKRRADEKLEFHFDETHRGEARIKAVFERRVKPHPEQDLADIVGRHHDRMADELPDGYELAYVVGEEVDAPDQINADPAELSEE